MQEMIAFVSDHKDEFVQLALEKSSNSQQTSIGGVKKRIESAQKRTNELDRLLMKLYEDKIAGNVPEEMFKRLSAAYLSEQSQLEQDIQVQREKLSALDTRKVNTKQFVDLVQGYTELRELTPTILNEFIEKICVYQQKVIDGKKTQNIEIFFRGVGCLNLHKEKTSSNRLCKAFSEVLNLLKKVSLNNLYNVIIALTIKRGVIIL